MGILRRRGWARRLHAFVVALRGMDDAIACAAICPHEEQDVFALGQGMDLAGELFRAGDGMAIDLEDDVAGSETSFLGWAGWAHAFYGRAGDALGQVELLAELRGEVVDSQAETAAIVRFGA